MGDRAVHGGGACPHDGRPCRFARACTLGRFEACSRAITGIPEDSDDDEAGFCPACRAAAGGECRFLCFRRDGYGMIAKKASPSRREASPL